METTDTLVVSEDWCTRAAKELADVMQCQFLVTNDADRAWYRTWTSLYYVIREPEIIVEEMAIRVLRRMAMNRRPSNTYELRESDFHAIVHVYPHGPTADGGYRIIIEILDEFACRCFPGPGSTLLGQRNVGIQTRKPKR